MDWAALVASFGGGIWGAAIGAVPAFIFTGLLALVGAVAALSGGNEVLQIAFGPLFGPHVSFGGGVAAAAFAGSRGVLPTGRDIGTPLMGLKRVDVLIVGGVFGTIGYLVNEGLVWTGVAKWTDTIALTVILSDIAARFLFGKTFLLGSPAAPTSRRFRPDDSATWLPWQQDWQHVAIISVAVALLSAYLPGRVLPRAGDAFAFGIAVVVLVFLVFGRKVPVTHHIALPAAAAVIHGAGFVGGVACGVLGGFIGEAASRALLIHGDTHIDPPAVGIAAVVLVLRIAAAVGLISGPI